ncbi:class F sortase [Paenibacillus sp. D2_2]|uniref:class F sortase n=1 Tax=Paenibacillus sp. D2_2 TaxID=3073092 RepID=UPI0028167E8B|nr:class F sortase [Paenibacillus sp. D2_2]WMT42698.1 class F sortase [Paenibacillus sp. D2_2]
MLRWKLTIITMLIAFTCSSCSAPDSAQIQKAPTDFPQASSKVATDSNLIQTDDSHKASEYSVHTPPTEPFLPNHLYIPSINVFARIMPVGVTENGQMDVPEDTNIAGILQPGVLPGAKGNVNMDGHVDSYTCQPSFLI